MKTLSSKDIARILARRDARYDGRLYFGVTTTGIYCRPVCPARPKPENVRPFRSLSEAERAGFRPCLRCRPDFAPGSALFEGTASSVSRALRLIETADHELSVAALAEKLGMTDRHLRRLFDDHLGASPVEILQSRRLHWARRLLRETSLPVSDIAFASGFGSLRRFNEAFRDLYRRTPSSFRQNRDGSAPAGLSFTLSVRKPYDGRALFEYLRRHEVGGIETVNDAYTRVLPGKGADPYGLVTVEWLPLESSLKVRLQDVPLGEARQVLVRLRRLFDTDHNPADLPRVGRGRGVRVPGAYDGFESAIGVILGQLVSTEQARAKMRALVAVHGRELGRREGSAVYEFPTPECLEGVSLEKLGLPRTRAQAIRSLAGAVRRREIDLSPAADLEETRARLAAIRGVGPWTVEMIAMRCLGDPDAYPDGDLIVRRAVERGVADPLEWGGLRAYFTQALWLDFARTLSKKKGSQL